MYTIHQVLRTIICAAAFACILTGPAEAADLHRFWESRCAECHLEAGPFARKHLTVVDGKLYGHNTARDIRLFLKNHYLGDYHVDEVYDMLLAQSTSGARFEVRCRPCHAKAAELVRDRLVRREATLFSRKYDRTLHEFLSTHQGLGPHEVPFFVQLLERIEREVRSP